MMADPPALTLDELTSEIKALVWRSWQDYYTLGNRLKLVKGMLTHGAWLAWLAEEMPFSVTTAERCMRADDLVQEYPALREGTIAVETSAIDLLTARKTPIAVVRRLVRDAANGTPITQHRVQTELAKVRLPRAPKISSKENLPQEPPPVADFDTPLEDPIPTAEAPRRPVRDPFDFEEEDGPSLDELIRRGSHPVEPREVRWYELGRHPEGDVWRLYRVIQGFLDYEAQIMDALGAEAGPTETVMDEPDRQAVAVWLLGLRTTLEAQGFPYDPEALEDA